MTEKKDRVKFRYEKNPEYKVIYANGAHGGITSRGEFRYELFIEYNKSPHEIIHSITPDGLGPEVERNPAEAPITRELQIGVIMSINQAKSVAHWILKNISDVEKVLKKEK